MWTSFIITIYFQEHHLANKSIADKEVEKILKSSGPTNTDPGPEISTGIVSTASIRDLPDYKPSRQRRVAWVSTARHDGSVVTQELGTRYTDFNTIVEEDGTAGVDMIDSEDDVHTAEQSRHCTLQMRQPRLRNPQMRASGGLILLMILAGVVLLFFLLSPDIEEIFSKYNCGATNIPLFLFQFILTQDNINSYSAG